VLDIESFLQPILKGGLFIKSGNLEKINIQKLQPANQDKPEFNALVRVEPDGVGQRVIKQLNRKPLNGKPINISEYFLRFCENDRRNRQINKHNDRRRHDRRRSGLQIVDITGQGKSDDTHRNINGWGTDITL
jgi:hypothetical protein